MELSQISKESECERKPMRKNQKDWIKYFNQKGMKMISAPDIYQIAKQEHKELIESLAKDFENEYWVVTSTKIVYNKDNLDAEIMHDADSAVVNPVSIKVKVPSIWGEVSNDKDVEDYLQALFSTKDNLDEIKKVLRRFNKDKELHLWTPNQSSRASKPLRSVGLGFDLGRFGVVGGGWVGGYGGGGLSRGVSVASADAKHKKGDAK